MAAPSYTTDLTTIAIGSITVDAGAWDESSDAGWDDAGAMVDDGNLYYNGSKCVSAQFTKTGVGTIMYEHISTFTVPTNGAILIHHLWAAPPALSTLTNGGVRILVGNGFGVFYGWKASGSDAPPAPRGGWANYAIDPAIGSPDYTVGTPATPYDTVGMAVSATAQARGNPNACNAVRYGRCKSIFEHGDISNGYATFAGYAAIDNAPTNRWNLIDPVKGGYEIQGLVTFGTATNAVDFRDANVNISLADTVNVTSSFTKFEVNNASSNIEWTAISVSALGTNCKGSFEVIDDVVVKKTSCTFTDMNTFIYKSNSELATTTYRRCGLVTQGSATFTDCIFDKASGVVALLSDVLGDVTGCHFISDGTGHAADLGTISSTQSLTWNNTESGYAGSNGSTGNETILVNVASGQTLTINVSTGASTPTYYNTGTGTVTVVAGTVTTQVTVKDSVSKNAVQGVAVTIKAATTGPLPFEASVTITRVGDIATVDHTGHGLSTGQKVEINGAVQNEYNRIKTITKIDADSYSYTVSGSPTTPATGTITSTAILIDGLTNVSGQISDSRTLSSNQDITGKVQKGSTSPVYKPQDIATTIDSSNGVNLSFLLIPD